MQPDATWKGAKLTSLLQHEVPADVRFGSWPCRNVFDRWLLGDYEEFDAF